MSHSLKFLLITALSSTVLIACSNETAQLDPSVVTSEQASATQATEKAAMLEKQAQKAKEMALKEQALKKQAMAEAEAEAAKKAAEKEAMKRAEEKMVAEKKAAKEAMARAEAQARTAKNAAEAKAAKEAMAQAETQRRLAEERQAALDAQRIRDAQIAREAQAARDAQVAQQASVQQAQAPVISEPVAPVSTNPNAPYNAFLSKYVSDVISAMNIEALPRDAEMATWFNLYNAKTIELILENYPTKSIRKISNPWKRDRLVVNGRKMSLDDIEHGTVRKKYNEPRVHYAFNCASIGCPNVKRTAWEASTLEADLAQASRDFVASERGVSVRDGKIIASSIFKWYKKDFGGNETGVLAHLRQYASGSKKAALDAANKINKYDYDWDLNIR